MTLIYTLLVICGFILLLCGFIVLTGKMLGQSGEIDVSVNQNKEFKATKFVVNK